MKQQTIGFFLVLSVTLFIAQGCRPLSRPGSRGEVPPVPPPDAPANRRANAVIEIAISGGIPQTPACGTTYVFTAEASEAAVECAGYTFGLLYREALRHADERMAELRCPNQCPQRNPYVIKEEGTCANGQAKVSLRMAVQCLAENTPPINGLSLRTDSDLRAPFDRALPDMPQTSNEHLTISIPPNGLAERCPFDFKFWIMLQERVNSCDVVADYASFVAKAERQAGKIWEATRCGPNCTKAQLREVGAQWGCAQDLVTVRYVFQVPCREN